MTLRHPPRRQPRRDRRPHHAHRRGRSACARSRSTPTPTRAPRTCASPTTRSGSARPRRRESYLRADLILEAALAHGRRRDPPGLRVPLRERRRSPARPRPPGIAFVGPTPAQLELFGVEAHGARRGPGGRRADARGHRAAGDARRGGRGGGRHRLPRHAQGDRRAAAASACARAAPPTSCAAAWERGARGRPAPLRLRPGVFLERLVDGRPARRGAGLRRRRGPRRHPRRPRLLAAAPPPEGGGGGPGARASRRGPRADSRRRPRTLRRVGRLPLRGHRRVRLRRRARGGRRSSRSTPGCRSSTRSPRRCSASTWSRGCCGWRRATRPSSTRPLDAARRTPSRPASTPRTPTATTCPSAGTDHRVRGPGRRPRRHLDRAGHRGVHRTTTRCWPRSSPPAPTATSAWAALGDGARATPALTASRRTSGCCARSLHAPEVAAALHHTGTLAHLHDPTPRIEVAAPGHAHHRPGLAGPHRAAGTSASRRRARWTTCRSGWATARSATPRARPAWSARWPGPALRFVTGATVMRHGRPARGHARRRARPAVGAGRGPGGRRAGDRRARRPGMRTYLLVAGGLDVPQVLGSARPRSTSAGSAGTAGVPLRAGRRAARSAPAPGTATARPARRTARASPAPGRSARSKARTPRRSSSRRGDIAEFYAADWEVHFNSARTGVRLVGPKPRWARPDGGEAGLHPSNIHDTPYAVGAVDYTGDMPILLGPDGPSLGGFVCPATVALGQRWKLGQLRPGDTVRFVPVDEAEADALRTRPQAPRGRPDGARRRRHPRAQGRRHRRSPTAAAATTTCSSSTAPMPLDLASRMRVHALAQQVQDRVDHDGLRGIVDLTPGIRSLQMHVDPDVLPLRKAARPGPRDRGRRCRATDGPRRPQPHRAPAAVLGRPGHPRGHRAVHGRRPRRRPVVPVEHRVHPPRSTAWTRSTTCTAPCSTRSTWSWAWATSTWAPRSPPRWTRGTAWSPPSTTRPAPGRRRTRSASAAPTCASTAWRARAATSSSAAPSRCGTRYAAAQAVRAGHALAAAVLRPHPLVPGGRGRAARPARGHGRRAPRRRASSRARSRSRSTSGSWPTTPPSIAAFRAQQAAAFGAERDAWAAAGEFDRVIEPDAPRPGGRHRGPRRRARASRRRSSRRSSASTSARATSSTRGQQLLALEAMKMEAPVTATVGGTVVDIVVTPGDQVGPGQVLVIVEPVAVSAAA